jgi:methionyl-tRNA synthetase
VERHPKADKLYIETISLGNETRQIVSGLVPYYKEEELQGRNIILVYNLKAATLRGVESQGMLLAAEAGDTIEVIFADRAEPGERVVVEGDEGSEPVEPEEITIDDFFSLPIGVENFTIKVEDRVLKAGGRPLLVEKVKNGTVG